MFKFVGFKGDKVSVEQASTIESIGEFLDIHGREYDKIAVYSPEGNLILFVDGEYVGLGNIISYSVPF